MLDTPVIVGFVCGCICAALLVLRYNLRTAVLVKNIQAIALSEGRTWAFWGDPHTVQAFVWSPSHLIHAADSPAIRASKAHLLQHRGTLWRWLFAACAFAIAGPALGILAMVLLAH